MPKNFMLVWVCMPVCVFLHVSLSPNRQEMISSILIYHSVWLDFGIPRHIPLHFALTTIYHAIHIYHLSSLDLRQWNLNRTDRL